MKKALIIGGTGTISAAVTHLLARDPEWKLFLLNRGNRDSVIPEGVISIHSDIHDEAQTALKLEGMDWDCVCEFIAFRPEDVERDYRLFHGKTKQYIFISTASAYQKPMRSPFITEETPLENPFWDYSRLKIACERFLREKGKEGFPITIVRPSHTYDERKLPVGIHGGNGSWQILRRMLEGKPVLVPGDGTSLWTVTHNSDFAKGFVGLMGNDSALGEAFHITSDEVLTWNQIYGSIADALGVKARLYHVSTEWLHGFGPYDYMGGLIGDKANSVIFDNSKLKKAVPGFHASTSFAQGAKAGVEYILSHPDCQKNDPAFDEWCDRVISTLEKAKEAGRG